MAEQLADAVTEHATPVGSGTVARTGRIPIEQRAESAVIAWLRHQTTAYENMKILRVKGKRREVRRMLAEHSRRLLEIQSGQAKMRRSHLFIVLAVGISAPLPRHIINARYQAKQPTFFGVFADAGNKSLASCVLYITGVQVLANLFPDGSSYPSDNFKQMTRPARDAREEESER